MSNDGKDAAYLHVQYLCFPSVPISTMGVQESKGPTVVPNGGAGYARATSIARALTILSGSRYAR